MSSISLSERVEYIKVAFTFGGALLGAIIGAPLVELFKDRLNAKRQWKTQNLELIATLRLVTGVLAAFRATRIQAYGPSQERSQRRPAHIDRLANFDLSIVDTVIEKLAALHPNDSPNSAAAQRLVEHLTVLKSYEAQMKRLAASHLTSVGATNIDTTLCDIDAEILDSFDIAYSNFIAFLFEVYAKRIGVDPVTLHFDPEVSEHERSLFMRNLELRERRWDELLAKQRRDQEVQRNA